jgi:hypothetical protein
LPEYRSETLIGIENFATLEVLISNHEISFKFPCFFLLNIASPDASNISIKHLCGRHEAGNEMTVGVETQPMKCKGLSLDIPSNFWTNKSLAEQAVYITMVSQRKSNVRSIFHNQERSWICCAITFSWLSPSTS